MISSLVHISTSRLLHGGESSSLCSCCKRKGGRGSEKVGGEIKVQVSSSMQKANDFWTVEPQISTKARALRNNRREKAVAVKKESGKIKRVLN